MKTNNTIIKRHLIKVMIIMLLFSAAIGIFIILTGDFSRTLTNSLTTCLTIAGYSLSGLCSTTIYNKLKTFSLVGLWVAGLGLLIALIAIWDVVDFNIIWKPLVILIIFSAAIAQASLLLLITPKTKLVKAVILLLILITFMLVKTVLTEYEENNIYFQILAVFTICYLLGIILTPILHKTISNLHKTITNKNIKS